MGVVPFFLYLFPVISGALADRFGYRRMFLLSFTLMAPSYYLLGYAKDLASFMMLFMMIALGAGIFKPVVTATISRTTDESNRGLGFGIFYMMVNIGGFLGPLLAPIVQKNYGWQWVFIFACVWISINFIPALFFYKEPTQQAKKKPIAQVFIEMQQVLGNLRLAMLVVPLLVLLVAFYANFIDAFATVVIVLALVAISLIWDVWVGKFYTQRPPSEQHEASALSLPWYQQKMHIGNKPFMVYLMILTGFWTVYMQIFVTLPVYIRDFVDTSDMVSLLYSLSPWLHELLTSVNLDTLSAEISRLAIQFQSIDLVTNAAALQEINRALLALDVRIPQADIIANFSQLSPLMLDNSYSEILARQWSELYRQINPATILSIDFFMIILFQVIISHFLNQYKALSVLIIGTAIIAVSMLIQGFAHGIIFGGLWLSSTVMVFALGEMFASPKSQEYVASFAPPDKAAMFMGYYFVSMALGNLFAGLLSGWLYGFFASQLKQPEIMWVIIAGLGFATCLALYFFDKHFVSEITKQQSAQQTQTVSTA
jgi:MFS family permease